MAEFGFFPHKAKAQKTKRLVEMPINVIALGKPFKGNDQLKTNTVLQIKDTGIEFKTI